MYVLMKDIHQRGFQGLCVSRSATEWAKNDEQLKKDIAFKEVFDQYSKPASQDSVNRTVRALTDKKHTVKVVENEKEAVEFLGSLIKDGMSISTGGSTTLAQIGFVDYLRSRDSSIVNYKGKAAAAAEKGDMGLHSTLLAKGLAADLFLSSVSAVTEEGDIFAADLTGTRVGGWFAAKQLVVVLGSNKIVANEFAAEKRLHDYQLKLESARVRVAFKVPASAVVNKVAIRSANPFGSRTTILIIKKALGF